MSEPLVSVIIPVWNVEEYLPHCIDSVLNQTYSNLEIILVDDGSPDRCGEICDEYAKKDDRIKVIHKENGGLSDARNAGLDICTGEYISFIDSDDIVSEFFIEVLFDAARQKGADIVGLVKQPLIIDYKSIWGRLSHDSNYTAEEKSIDDMLKLIFYQKIETGAPFYLFKRSIWESLRFPVGWLYEDAATIHRAVLKADRAVVVDKVLYGYFVRKGSIMNVPFSEKNMMCVDVGRRIYEDIEKARPELLGSAAVRGFSVNYQFFYKIPVENKKAREALWKELVFYRPYVLGNKDKEMRFKDRMGAWLMCLGMNKTFYASRLIMKIVKV